MRFDHTLKALLGIVDTVLNKVNKSISLPAHVYENI